MRETSVVEVDLAAVAHNVGIVRRIVGPGTALCPVVKADAYGLGAVRVAKCLVHAGVELLAVYTADQAAELFRAAVSGPVLVLMPVRGIERADEVYRGLVCGRLHLSVHDSGHLDDLVRLSEQYAVTIPLHLEVDTGMSRGGCDLAQASRLLRRIMEHPRLRLAGLYTHFACAESNEAMTDEQDDRFEALVREHEDLLPEDCVVHAANTCATLRSRRYHKRMVRIGQAWAGYGTEMIRDGRPLDAAEGLRPAVTWRSRIIQIKEIAVGARVGYGSTWTAPRPSVIGLVPVGYSDGYPYALGRAASAGRAVPVSVIAETPDGPVRGDAPIVGNVNMDQITIDLTDLVGGVAGSPRVGTPVEIITPERGAANHLVRIAEAADTTPYEILCRLNPRIPRRYRAVADVEILASAPPRPAASLPAG